MSKRGTRRTRPKRTSAIEKSGAPSRERRRRRGGRSRRGGGSCPLTVWAAEAVCPRGGKSSRAAAPRGTRPVASRAARTRSAGRRRRREDEGEEGVAREDAGELTPVWCVAWDTAGFHVEPWETEEKQTNGGFGTIQILKERRPSKISNETSILDYMGFAKSQAKTNIDSMNENRLLSGSYFFSIICHYTAAEFDLLY